MSLLMKDPDALLDYAVHWGDEYLAADDLIESSWSVIPTEPNGVTIVASAFDERSTSVQVTGGLPGRLYRVVNHIATAAGREDNRSLMLRVERR